MSPSPFTASILETSASAYAGFAASSLLENQPDLEQRYQPKALEIWKANLRQRLLELSAALEVGERQLFISTVRWAQAAFRARNGDEQDLRHGLTHLLETLRTELPAPGKEVVVSYVEAALRTFDESPVEEVALAPSGPIERRALAYLEASLRGDARGAIELVTAELDEGLCVRDTYEILLMAQREAGRMWHIGDLDILEEHLVSTTTQRAMAVLAERVQRRPSNGKTVVVAAVAKNTHGLSVRVVADFFEIDGWRSICLGADVPPAEIAKAALYFAADLVALSVALPTQIKAARQSIEAIRALPEHPVKVLIGGLALSETPELWSRLGADGSALSAEAAITVGGRLVGLDPPSPAASTP